MSDAAKNFAYSLVATAPSPASSGTSLVVTAAQGALFPAVPFDVTIWPTAVQPISSNAEIATVTAVSTDTLTIVRAQQGTGARTVVVGDQIAATIHARTLNDLDGERAPAAGLTVRAGFSKYIVGDFEVAATAMLDIKAGGTLEIG